MNKYIVHLSPGILAKVEAENVMDRGGMFPGDPMRLEFWTKGERIAAWNWVNILGYGRCRPESSPGEKPESHVVDEDHGRGSESNDKD